MKKQKGTVMEKRETKKIKIRSVTLGAEGTKICIPLTARSFCELREQAGTAVQGPCDMAEWRADFFEETAHEGWVREGLSLLREILAERVLLFTFRTKEEGGERSLPLSQYAAVNLEAAGTGLADMIDVEINRGEQFVRYLTKALHQNNVIVLHSFHDFAGTPSGPEIVHTLCRMEALGADITKAAVMPCTDQDVLALLEAAVEMKHGRASRPFVVLSMGQRGSVSRIACALTGSAFTFAASGQSSAPGQMESTFVKRALEALS